MTGRSDREAERVLRGERKCLAGVDHCGDGDAADGVGHGVVETNAFVACRCGPRTRLDKRAGKRNQARLAQWCRSLGLLLAARSTVEV